MILMDLESARVEKGMTVTADSDSEVIEHEPVKNERLGFSWPRATGKFKFIPLHSSADLLPGVALSASERFVGLFFGPGDYIPRHIASSSPDAVPRSGGHTAPPGRAAWGT